MTLSLPNISNAHICNISNGANELYIQDKRKQKSIPNFYFPFKKKKSVDVARQDSWSNIIGFQMKKKQIYIVQNPNDVNTNMSRSD